MNGRVITFDPGQIDTIVDGGVVTGYGESDMISFSFDEDNNIKHADVKGHVDRAVSATRTGKIGYDDEGISSMVAEVRTVLNLAASMGIILIENETPVYDIEVLSRRDVPRNDVANRVYNGIRVTATVAGAIESGEINIDLVI